MTIKDKYAIPIIKELLDKLGKAIFFSKLGFHSRFVSMNPSKIAYVKSWPRPTSLKEFRGLFRLSSYYRCFIKHYHILARLLTDLLKKDKGWQWPPEPKQLSVTLNKL
ncbi:hypothetical protein CXB51_034661 [Gossypium anomalum]|uniref:Reverse transcriptase/retrotransposon-derived protein RNase H-like domain-containing protein n=1 Tax=Gossypium anomalum TaxID=47600 RepID=A0A8J6CJ29_9ROSI|nr:hypothetical protein CXB51_034661 [Gossypium anomalum]